MSIARARLKPYSLSLREPWPSADGPVRQRLGWLLALEDDAGRVGIGDAAPFPGFGTETHASAESGLKLALKKLVGMPRQSYAEAITELKVLAPVAAAPTARHAIDGALHDLMAQEADAPLARYLGGSDALRDVPANATIPRVSPERAASLAESAAAAGARAIKVKVGGGPPADDRARLEAIRAAVGPEVAIRVDANQAWNPREAVEALRSFVPLGIEYAEQPVAAGDVEGLKRVRGECGIPIAADEAVHDMATAESVLYGDAVDVLILKPMVVGGLREARSILTLAEERRVPVVVTSLLESAVGRTAALHFAASLGPVRYAHGVATAGIHEEDIAPYPEMKAGAVPVPAVRGLGVAPPPEFWNGAFTMEAE